MLDTMLQSPLLKLFNRVLGDYPLAREQLQKHSGKLVAATVGPVEIRMRIGADGDMEMVGAGNEAEPPAVSFAVPLALLPRLARGDESSFAMVVFSGDSELAATLSTVARNVEWDIEEDISRVTGDVIAHRVVGSAKSLGSWARDAESRLTASLAEYLSEERRSFITRRELEELATANETLRDDLARLGARLGKLTRAT